ncbi:regulatory LuxR family protein [Serratia fonticola]|uniref:Regulatory LuxR family protein n=1 Tax=Serratia fonticola TaxID=47917 RepID=A0A542BFA2_SERFO|nr:LuxR C-terminal-related transcriptional regulator [Serratia fonticola]TQI77266.1 regulatory LuxR family protein [Serratia fonticola]TQI93608.1 regulatory LuxR family protein [Serratia fonticola]TVZ61638.1 regulatory LuxR family protein [Serratia fonticola]
MLNLETLWKQRLMFPELTESQFQVLMYYAFGSNSEGIADILKCSKNAVKLSLRRIKENLNVDKLETVRIIYHSRTYTAMMAPDDFPQKYYETMANRP